MAHVSGGVNHLFVPVILLL